MGYSLIPSTQRKTLEWLMILFKTTENREEKETGKLQKAFNAKLSNLDFIYQTASKTFCWYRQKFQ